MIGNPVVRRKSHNLSSIDEAFGNIRAKVSVQASLESIKRCIMKEYDGVDIQSISLVDNEGTFYGMRTFYSQSTIAVNTKSLSSTVTKNNSGYPELKKTILATDKIRANTRPELHIEIDPDLLYSKVINLTGEELTSILLHEIGHFGIHASDFFDKFRMSFLLSLSKWGARSFALVKVMPYGIFSGLVVLIVSEIVLSSNLMSTRDVEETLADRFVIDQGYGYALESAMSKMVEARLAAYKSKMSKSEDKDMIDKTDVIVSMSLQTFSQLSGRRDQIRRTMAISRNSLSSPIYKMYIDEFLDNMFEKMHPSKLVDTLINHSRLAESMELDFYKLNENIFKKLLGWDNIKFSDKDLDAIRIDIEMIRDYDDKIYTVDKIHRNMGSLNKAIEYMSNDIENDSYMNAYEKDKKIQDINTLKGYVRTLSEYRDKALSVKIVDTEYGLFVKVPKGYEG
ncbi:MAG: hypothetical protein ACRC0G_07875 [Fusobacteriaceae bacterium]